MSKPRRKDPPVSDALLDWLDEVYPDRLPGEEVSPFDLGVLVGRQQVIKRLRKASVKNLSDAFS